VSNPFDGDETDYLVLVNEQDQHSLWPAPIAVPPGWRVVLAEASRERCLEFVENRWIDMRPRSLRPA
jgi:MbtH protein